MNIRYYLNEVPTIILLILVAAVISDLVEVPNKLVSIIIFIICIPISLCYFAKKKKDDESELIEKISEKTDEIAEKTFIKLKKEIYNLTKRKK